VIGAVVFVCTIIGFLGGAGSVYIFGLPLFGICVAIIFLIQWLSFIPAYLFRTERFFDLIGGVTYITLAIFVILVRDTTTDVGYMIGFLVSVWAFRLSFFLFSRILTSGSDRRFNDIKSSFGRFLMTWTLQGGWIFMTFAAGLAAMSSNDHAEIGFLTILGLSIWVVGFFVEVVADAQKKRFRSFPENSDNFITNGLWGYSRHPNYLGEIVLWLGIAIIAIPLLSGWQFLTLLSPVFVWFLLTRISGLPMLEAYADEKWGDNSEYANYKRNTPVLFPSIRIVGRRIRRDN